MPDQAEQACYDQTLIWVGTQRPAGQTHPVAPLGAAVNDAIGISATGICHHALKRPPLGAVPPAPDLAERPLPGSPDGPNYASVGIDYGGSGLSLTAAASDRPALKPAQYPVPQPSSGFV